MRYVGHVSVLPGEDLTNGTSSTKIPIRHAVAKAGGMCVMALEAHRGSGIHAIDGAGCEDRPYLGA